MRRTTEVIRLVGGPPKLDGARCDLRLSDDDRADASDGRFVRAVNGTTITALAALQHRCHDQAAAFEIAETWRVALYRAGGVRRRTRLYHFEGHHALEPRRDGLGRWGVALGPRSTGSRLPPPDSPPSVWSALESAVDEAARRFVRVASLIPDGALAARARQAENAVASCVADARRLCAVGATVTPDADRGRLDDRTAALFGRVGSLVHTIDLATAQLVDLHLEVHDAVDPVAPVAHIAEGWSEVRGGDGRDDPAVRLPPPPFG